jgi:hypothetical protein
LTVTWPYRKVSFMKVEEIEAAIAQLPRQDLAELVSWLHDHTAQIWDKQIDEDLRAGRLDSLLAEVDDDYDDRLLR